MVKLVVSDLDGTLLPKGDRILKEEVFTMLNRLKEKEVLFAVASGRSYKDLKRFFAQAAYDIIFICENGALIMYKEEVLYQKSIPKRIGISCIREMTGQMKYEWLAAGLHTSYITSRSSEYMSFLKANGIYPMRVDRLLDIPEDFLRISVYHRNSAKELNNEVFVREWEKVLGSSYWGENWLDFTHKEVNKGTALLQLKERFLKSGEEILAFGDQDNDREMLELADYGYRMGTKEESVLTEITNVTNNVLDTINAAFPG